MRINVYSHELPAETAHVECLDHTGVTYDAVRIFLLSHRNLHHVPEDDDRSAVTFWLPKTRERREQIALAFDAMARIIRKDPPK